MDCKSAKKANQLLKRFLAELNAFMEEHVKVQLAELPTCIHGEDMTFPGSQVIEKIEELQWLIETHTDVPRRENPGREHLSKSGEGKVQKDSGVISASSKDLKSTELKSNNLSTTENAAAGNRLSFSKNIEIRQRPSYGDNIDREAKSKLQASKRVAKTFAITADNKIVEACPARHSPDNSNLDQKFQTSSKTVYDTNSDTDLDAHSKDDSNRMEKDDKKLNES